MTLYHFNYTWRETVYHAFVSLQNNERLSILLLSHSETHVNVCLPGLPRNMSTRRSTKAFKAFEGRRNSIMAAQRRKSQMQTLGANNIYGVAGNALGIQPRPTRSSQISVKDVFENNGAHTNLAYEAEESPRNSLRMRPLATQIAWRESNSNLWKPGLWSRVSCHFVYVQTCSILCVTARKGTEESRLPEWCELVLLILKLLFFLCSSWWCDNNAATRISWKYSREGSEIAPVLFVL